MNVMYNKEFEFINNFIKEHAELKLKQVLMRKIGTLDAFGLSMKDIRALGKKIGLHHGLAIELFSTNMYEYLMLASIIADPIKLDLETTRDWLKRAQSTSVVDQGLSPLLMNHPERLEFLKSFLYDKNDDIRYGGFSLLSSYLRSESLETLDTNLGNDALLMIKNNISTEPLTIQNAMNNAVVMAGLHVPLLVDIARDVASHVGHIMPLVARNQCNIQSASDYLKRYSNQPKYSRVAMLQARKG